MVDAVLGAGAAEVGGSSFEVGRAVGHGHAGASGSEHLQIVVAVAKGHGVKVGRHLLFLHVDESAVNVEEEDLRLVHRKAPFRSVRERQAGRRFPAPGR